VLLEDGDDVLDPLGVRLGKGLGNEAADSGCPISLHPLLDVCDGTDECNRPDELVGNRGIPSFIACS